MINITVEFPPDIAAAVRENKDARASFRRMMENRLRGRFNRSVRAMQSGTRYQKTAGGFEVHQETTGDVISFAVVNTNPAEPYLLGGSAPHVIEERPHVVPLYRLLRWAGGNLTAALIAQARIKERGVIIHHPGIPADAVVLAELQKLEASALAAVVDGTEAWADSWAADEGGGGVE